MNRHLTFNLTTLATWCTLPLPQTRLYETNSRPLLMVKYRHMFLTSQRSVWQKFAEGVLRSCEPRAYEACASLVRSELLQPWAVSGSYEEIKAADFRTQPEIHTTTSLFSLPDLYMLLFLLHTHRNTWDHRQGNFYCAVYHIQWIIYCMKKTKVI